MHAPYMTTRGALSRRHFLRGAGAAAIGLPLLEAMRPTFSSRAAVAAAEQSQRSPKRFVAACATLGFHVPFLVPQQAERKDGGEILRRGLMGWVPLLNSLRAFDLAVLDEAHRLRGRDYRTVVEKLRCRSALGCAPSGARRGGSTLARFHAGRRRCRDTDTWPQFS